MARATTSRNKKKKQRQTKRREAKLKYTNKYNEIQKLIEKFFARFSVLMQQKNCSVLQRYKLFFFASLSLFLLVNKISRLDVAFSAGFCCGRRLFSLHISSHTMRTEMLAHSNFLCQLHTIVRMCLCYGHRLFSFSFSFDACFKHCLATKRTKLLLYFFYFCNSYVFVINAKFVRFMELCSLKS